jgi:hypothetical protein
MNEKIQFRIKVIFKVNSEEKNEVHKVMAKNAAEAIVDVIQKYRHITEEMKVYVKPI